MLYALLMQLDVPLQYSVFGIRMNDCTCVHFPSLQITLMLKFISHHENIKWASHWFFWILLCFDQTTSDMTTWFLNSGAPWTQDLCSPSVIYVWLSMYRLKIFVTSLFMNHALWICHGIFNPTLSFLHIPWKIPSQSIKKLE